MASGDRRISELPAATSLQDNDLLVLQQNDEPKSLSGQVLVSELLKRLDGHGGIRSWELTGSDGRKDIYTITFADGSAKTLTVTNGEKGDKGDPSYVWIRYASEEPTEASHAMSTVPDDWIGIYTGFSAAAPTDWKDYTWARFRGEKGDSIKGDPGATPQLQMGMVSSVSYDEPASATIAGTPENPILNLRIPMGRPGADGEYASDWNENDSGNPGHVLNRTHYEVSPKLHVFGSEVPIKSGNNSISLPDGITMEYGVVYDISLDGITYRSRCQDIVAVLDAHVPAVGNLYLLNRQFENTGEPFALYIFDAGTATLYAPDHAGKTVTFDVYQAETVKKLDNKFLEADWTATKTVRGISGPVLDGSLAFTGSSLVYSKMAGAGLVKDGRYTVTWGGTDYECICFADRDGALYLGDGALAGEPQGEIVPFCFVSFGGTSSIVYKSTADTETIQASIVGHRDESLEKLPEEFLPDIILTSQNGGRFKLLVSNTGTVSSTKIN